MQGSFGVLFSTSQRMQNSCQKQFKNCFILNTHINYSINRNSDAYAVGADPHSFPLRAISNEEFVQIHHSTSRRSNEVAEYSWTKISSG